MMNPVILANISAFTAIVLWSTSASWIVYLKNYPPLQLLAMCQLIGFVTYLVKWVILKKGVVRHFKFPLKSYLICMAGICVAISFYYIGMRSAPPLEANLINYLWPLLIVLFSTVFMKAPFEKRHIISVLMGFVGATLLILREGTLTHFAWYTGYSFVFIGAVIWALYSLYTRNNPVNQNNMGVIFGLSSICLFALSYGLEEVTPIQSGIEFVFILLLSLNVFAYSFWNYAMKYGDVKVIAIYSYFIPLLSTLWLILFGLDQPNTQVYAATVLIVGGSLVGNLDKLKLAYRRLRTQQQ
jgi:drug/metabolite transporter (DMT)-like permease